LRNLRNINLSGCHLDHDVPALWMLPSLQEAILYKTTLTGVPVEILSKDRYGDNCLDRLRAHLADLTGDDVAMSDVKLMILGSGRVGKTQICRRLRGESFDETVPSTHGIQVSSVPLTPHVFDAAVTLKIWDFGGQDIYHGTHALFLKSRAVYPLVWTPKLEAEQFHTHGGFTFRNQPLAYWLAYVRTFGGPRSPVLVIQSQCDRPEDERDPPLPPGALDGVGYKKVLHYSAKGDGTHARGHAALTEALLDAVQWMRDKEGVAKIGRGRAAVKEALEAKLAAGQRLISHQAYLDLCAEIERTRKGRISDPALLLDYLHNVGTVFYREGLFNDQIVLDQAWALEAVYAVFDRASQSIKKIERNHGRFRRSELAEWVWQKHGVAEQELFLSFMQQCGICFTLQEEDHEKRVEAEYIAPDLLPARSDDETQKRLKLVWDEATPDAKAVLTFTLLPPGLMRALIARIGNDAGLAAEYWRDGVCFYDEKTASRALIEQRWTEGWAGEVRIATKRGQAGVLLRRLIELVENDRISLGARPSGKNVTGVEAKGEAREAPDAKSDEMPVRPAHEPSKVLEYYVSYAWGDDTTEGKEREAVVDRLCSEAEARGKRIIRDKTAMEIGDRISIFMDRIGKGAVNGRVCIVLSDKYLKSPYCMHELFDVWRNCREDGGTFIDRTRAFVLPSAKIATAIERAQYVVHWQSQFKEADALVREHGQLVLSDKDNAEFRLMNRFVSETANVLHLVQDTLHPRSFDDYVHHVFD
jgi:internalin A